MAGTIIQDHRYRDWRAELKTGWANLNTACGICGQATIDYNGPPNEPESFEMDHRISRKKRPDLAMVTSNVQPAHFRCNRNKGSGTATAPLGETTEDW